MGWAVPPTTLEQVEVFAARLAAVLSVLAGAWSLPLLALPFGVVGGGFVALFGLAFGVLALLAPAGGGWRKAALAGIAVSGLALVGAIAELVYFVLSD